MGVKTLFPIIVLSMQIGVTDTHGIITGLCSSI